MGGIDRENHYQLSLSLSLSLIASLILTHQAPVSAQTCPAIVAPSPYPGTDLPIPPLPDNQRECSIAVNPTDLNNWIVAYMDDRLFQMCPSREFRRDRVYVTYTTNALSGNPIWSTPLPMTPGSDPQVDSYDPILAINACGVACLLYVERTLDSSCNVTSTKIVSRTSYDKGQTWPVMVVPESHTGSSPFVDKPWLITPGPGSTCDMEASCTFGVSANFYAVWMHHTEPPLAGKVRFGKSKDGGLTWATQDVSGFGSFAYATLAASINKVYAGWAELPLPGQQARFYCNYSNDCGLTFLSPSQALAGFKFQYVYFAVGPYHGCYFGQVSAQSLLTMAAFGNTLLVAFANQDGTDCQGGNPQTDIRYNTSGDQGANWTWRGLDPDPLLNQPCPKASDVPQQYRDAFHPMLVASPSATSNNVLLTYYDRRSAQIQQNREYDLRATGACCVAAGIPNSQTPALSWATSIVLNSALSDPFFGLPVPPPPPAPQYPIRQQRIGDYTGLALFSSNVGVAAWTDCRAAPNTTLQDLWWNAYFLACSGDSGQSGAPSTVSRSSGASLELRFGLGPQSAGAPYRVFVSGGAGPGRILPGRVPVPLSDDALSREVEGGRRGIASEGLEGCVPITGEVRARIDFPPDTLESDDLFVLLGAGIRYEVRSGLLRIRVTP